MDELEHVVLASQIHIKDVGKRDTITIDPRDTGGVWASSIVLDGECVKVQRNGHELWFPVSSVRQMRPKRAAVQAAPQPQVAQPKPERVAVVVPVEMPDEVTPSAEEPKRRGRTRKAQP